MNIIVVGCGRVGSDLAYRLFQRGHQVTVIDQKASAFSNLPPDFRGRQVEGELLSQDVLHRAGIEEAEALAAVTNSDSFNAVVAHLARTAYHVPKVVVRNFDPQWRSLHEAFGLEVVSSSLWGAQRTEELLCQAPIRTVFSAGTGGVKICELIVPGYWDGRKLGELAAEGQWLPVGLDRSGQGLLPSPEILLQKGDLLYLSITGDCFEALHNRLQSSEEV